MKSIFASKTLWFNLFGGLVALVPDVATKIPEPWGALVLVVGNILLRYVTTQPVALKL